MCLSTGKHEIIQEMDMIIERVNGGIKIWDELDFDFDKRFAFYTGGPTLIDMTPDAELRQKRCYNRLAMKRALASMIQDEEI
jgi:DNA-binding GntR family transcriptional regulator